MENQVNLVIGLSFIIQISFVIRPLVSNFIWKVKEWSFREFHLGLLFAVVDSCRLPFRFLSRLGVEEKTFLVVNHRHLFNENNELS